MWETTKLPPGCVDRLNRFCAVVLPSRFCADVFGANGVVAPLYVVAPGISATEYAPKGEPPIEVCRFGTAGRLAHGGPRKGVEDVIAAFREAFPSEPDAALSVKVWPDCHLSPVNDPRVTIVRTPLTTGELADWYRSLTVYVRHSRARASDCSRFRRWPAAVPRSRPHSAAMASTSTRRSDIRCSFTTDPPMACTPASAIGVCPSRRAWSLGCARSIETATRPRTSVTRRPDARVDSPGIKWPRASCGPSSNACALDHSALLPDDDFEPRRSP